MSSDVAIVGYGPVGQALAILLGQRGWRVHVIERFTPVDAGTIRYEFTVDDPDTWTASWSGEMEIRRIDGPIYEYACHEGNYSLRYMLEGARARDAAAPQP